MTSPALLATRRPTPGPRAPDRPSVTVLTRHVGGESLVFALHSDGRHVLDRAVYGVAVYPRVQRLIEQLAGPDDAVIVPYAVEGQGGFAKPSVTGRARVDRSRDARERLDAILGQEGLPRRAAVCARRGDGGYGMAAVLSNGRTVGSSGRFEVKRHAVEAAIGLALRCSSSEEPLVVEAHGRDFDVAPAVVKARSEGRIVTFVTPGPDSMLMARAERAAAESARYVARLR